MGENLNKYGMKPLTKKNYFVYGLGNFASQLSWTMVSTYLSIFYTDVFGLGTGSCSTFDVNCKGLGWDNRPDDGNTYGTYTYKMGKIPSIYCCWSSIPCDFYNTYIYGSRIQQYRKTCIRVYYIHWSWNVIYHDKCSIPGITVCNDTGPERNQPVKCGTDDGNDNRTDRFKSICIKACVMVWKR